MEHKDLALIKQLILSDPELGRLWHEHLALETQLETMKDYIHLTPEEQIKRKNLQKIKLAGRDRIEAILARYRQSE